MGNIAGLRLAGCGPTSMCTGVGNCGDWKNRQTSSDGLVLGPWGKGSSPSYEYPACGSSSTPRNPFEGPQLESPASSASPARDLVRKFVRDMLQGVAAVLPPAWPGDVCGHNVTVSLDKRMKVLCVRSTDPSVEVSTQLGVPLTSIASIAFGCCNPGEGRLSATEHSVTLFLDEGYGPSIVLEFRDLEERDTFAICLSMFVDGRKAWQPSGCEAVEVTVKAFADHFSQCVPSFIERHMRASQSTPELHQLERSPSGGLAFRASQPRSLEGETPAVGNKLDLRRRAAEIVALNSLYAQSSSGSLQHAAIPRIRHVLEARDELLAEQASENRGMIRDKHWVRDRLRREKAFSAQVPPTVQAEPKWVLRRGTWYYEGGPKPERLPADEAMDNFVKAEEARGQPLGCQQRRHAEVKRCLRSLQALA
ncbi:Wwox [Symbiodinium sp. CCMP2456]|nr:Wwox [Symbiodinium sp. CCMP2456]